MLNLTSIGLSYGISSRAIILTQGAGRFILRLGKSVRGIDLRDRCVKTSTTMVVGVVYHLLRIVMLTLLILLILLLLLLLLLKAVGFYPLLILNMTKIWL